MHLVFQSIPKVFGLVEVRALWSPGHCGAWCMFHIGTLFDYCISFSEGKCSFYIIQSHFKIFVLLTLWQQLGKGLHVAVIIDPRKSGQHIVSKI